MPIVNNSSIITDIANHLEIMIGPLLTSGIIGTTLSVTIYSHLLNTPYSKNSYWVLYGSICFAVSSILTLLYINAYEDMLLLRFSRYLLLAGLVFILISIIPLFRMIGIEESAEETEQFRYIDPRLSSEYVEMRSP